MNIPEIKVGIITAPEIKVDRNSDGSFTIYDVPIGIDFHWERKENQTFNGDFEIIENEGQKTLINTVSIEEYLVSVISSEMSATSALEFLKAHAVISRTWLLAQKEKALQINKNYSSVIETGEEYIKWYDREDHSLFDVCADDHCQRYQGITRAYTPAVKKVVQETCGEILTYQGEICDTRFSKCCGGKTEDFENVWEPVHHPYLVSITDPFCHTNDEKILSQVLNNYDQETGDFYRWKVEVTQEKLAKLIRDNSGWDFGEIKDLIPIERGKSGRITRLKIVGTKMEKVIGKELFIRRVLSETHLYSSAFEVDKIFENEGEIPTSFRLYGKGWGHGVGLCQIGAAMMAEKGYSYQDILQYYFPGTQLEKRYE
jgi:SpoIID/LytB domain